MKWKFWRKTATQQPGASGNVPDKSSRPKSLPQQIGQYLVVKRNLDPDWVWNLKCVLRPRGQQTSAFDFRVFSPQSGVHVGEYNSLSDHPELILFHGWYDKRSNEIELFDQNSGKAA